MLTTKVEVEMTILQNGLSALIVCSMKSVSKSEKIQVNDDLFILPSLGCSQGGTVANTLTIHSV